MVDVAFEDERVVLWHGDCLDVLKRLDDASVDAVVTDPPYGIEFMGAAWDSFSDDAVSRSWDTRGRVMGEAPERDPSTPGGRSAAKTHIRDNPRCRKCGRTVNGRDTAKGFKVCHCPEPDIYAPSTSARKFQAWCEAWAAECLRVLKPGGHLLAFGGTRTWHRLTCAIEDAGFEIRDTITWLYSQGFPKSLDVGKAIDKAAGAEREAVGVAVRPDGSIRDASRGGRSGDSLAGSVVGVLNTNGAMASLTAPATDDAARWQGWGTALKPASEPVVVARKPLAGTVAATVVAHGTGALNIDGCRVATDWTTDPNRRGWQGGNSSPGTSATVDFGTTGARVSQPSAGRWPANVVLTHAQADDGGDACADVCVAGCPVADLDAQSGKVGAHPVGQLRRSYDYAPASQVPSDQPFDYGDKGSASRFFPTFRYQAKAPTRERPKVDGVAHPTVKPLTLMSWLVRLVTPPGGTVLDPFAGSGTTVEAALAEGFRCVAVEREAEYLPLILARIDRQPKAVPAPRVAAEPMLF